MLPSAAVGTAELRLTRALDRHRDRLSSVLSRTGIGSGDAEDVVQEAFCVLARRLGEVPERAERTFLTNTALRLASDRRRSVWHGIMSEAASPDDWDAGFDDGPEALYERERARRRLDAALGTLPEEERSAYLLVEAEAMSRQEASELLGVPAGTVASRLARARARIETSLRELPEPVSPCAAREPDSIQIVGNRRFDTNAWGYAKSRDRFEQRLVRRRRAGEDQLGWYWYWRGFDQSAFAFPEVLIGWKPWSGGVPTDPRLPVSVAASERLAVTFAVETRATGTHNLALSTWLSRSPGWSVASDPAKITTEVMVWPDYTPGATPPGRFVESLRVEGEPYELWRAVAHGKQYRHGLGWTVLTLRGAGGKRRGTVPFGALLGELGRRGYVAPENHVTCIELGNEVMGGAGTTFVEQFSIEL
jgi:RNA polymerase sigma factor (sigma-70 family)